MKRYVVLGVFVLILSIPAITNAAIKLLEDKMKITLDVSSFPTVQQESYKIFEKKCSRHHGLYRPITAIKTGKTPVTESAFGKKEIKKYIVKMMRKPNSGIDRDNAKKILKFIYFLIENRHKIKEVRNQ